MHQSEGNLIRHYDKRAGLPFTGFNHAQSLLNARGELLTGVAHGFIRFHPDSLQNSDVGFSRHHQQCAAIGEQFH